MLKFIKKLIIGPNVQNSCTIESALQMQRRNLLAVWNNTPYTSFGIERLLRLFLVLNQYLFPSLYIRQIAGCGGSIVRNLSAECIVLIKCALLIAIFLFHWENIPFMHWLIIYLCSETILYLLSTVFLSEIYWSPRSYKRSTLMLLLNYFEITFDFSVLYYSFKCIENLSTPIKAIYFSFVTSSALGFGDLRPINNTGRFLIICQIVVFLFFVFLFFTRFFHSKPIE